jgi:hypothetical protein
MKNHLPIIGLSVTIIVFMHPLRHANCQTLLTENFSYPALSSLTANGWNAHSSAGTNPVKVHSNGLSFPGYIGTDIGLSAILSNTGEDVNKTFTPVTAGNVYFAFLVKVYSGTNEYFFNIGRTSMGTTHRGKVYTDMAGNNFDFGLSLGTKNPDYTSGKAFDTAKVYLVVLKYSFKEGIQNDEVSLFAFSDLIPTEEPVIPAIGPLADATLDDVSNLGTIALRQYSSAQKIVVDGIRVATKWEDAVGLPTNKDEMPQNKEPLLYPVPAGDELIFRNINDFSNIEIFDFRGEKIFSVETNGNEAVNIQIGNLPKGVYIVRLNTKRLCKIMKFIKS